MPLPTFRCPCCRNLLTLETVLANESVRECLVLLMDAHPGASSLLRPLLSYLGLFAPAKQDIRYERMATILSELVPMIRSAQVQRNGRTWPAPLDYWRQGLEEVVARGHNGGLKLPLKSQGYLLEVVSQLAAQDDSKRERTLENQRAGHAGAGTSSARIAQSSVSSTPTAVREAMPAHVREQLSSIVRKGAVK